ncbi:hypothetical protein ABBQ38_014938 [Trebouxia sp. C0009 RCD-2024]
MRTWREWLPEDVAHKATEQEPQRFAAIVSGLATEWKHNQDPALTLKWLSLFSSYLHVKGDYRSEDLNKAATTILDIVLNCQHSSAAQARWAEAASQLLRTWRHQIDITVPWRRLYEFAHGFVRSSDLSYEGPLILETRQASLFHLVHRCKRFFPSGE